MPAPALITLLPAHATAETAAAATAIVDRVRSLRPDLRVELASHTGGVIGLVPVAARLEAEGFPEAVVVPLTLSLTTQDRDDILSLISEAQSIVSGVLLELSEPVGHHPAFLAVLDERLRTALRRNHVSELHGLVLATAGTEDTSELLGLERLARAWGRHHNLPAATAFAAVAPPSTGEAIRGFHRRGRRNIAVASFFLTADASYNVAREIAWEAGAVAVSAPLGSAEVVAEALLGSYTRAVFQLVPLF